MDISFASKKEDEPGEGDKKIEFARKFDPNLGNDKKPQPASSPEKEDDDLDVVEEKPTKENFFTKLIDKLKSMGSGDGHMGGDVLEVNLIKEEIVKYFDWQKGVLLLLLSMFLSMSIISFAYWGISWWGTKKQYTQNPVYMQSYYKITKEIKDREGDVNEVLDFKHRLDMANFVLSRHIYWSNFFDFLEDNTLSNVFFSSFSGDINGNYHLSATTNNFDVINAQTKKFLNNPYVRGAAVESGNIAGENGKVIVSFDITLGLDPKIFLKK